MSWWVSTKPGVERLIVKIPSWIAIVLKSLK